MIQNLVSHTVTARGGRISDDNYTNILCYMFIILNVKSNNPVPYDQGFEVKEVKIDKICS